MYSVKVDCLCLSLSTLQHLLGPVSEDEADRVRQELAELADVVPAMSWHDVWRRWRREVSRSVAVL
jgi:hypothetical protein